MMAAALVIVRTLAAALLGAAAVVAFGLAWYRSGDPLIAALHGVPWLFVGGAILPSKEKRDELAAHLAAITEEADAQREKAAQANDQEKA